MQRTKILLNVHNFFPAVLEFARIMPALAAGMCVVSEAAASRASTDARIVSSAVYLVENATVAINVIRTLLENSVALEQCAAAGIALAREQTLDAWINDIIS